MKVIYCGANNQQFARVAYSCGFYYGARLPGCIPGDVPLFFADQDWKNPDMDTYVEAVGRYKPVVASVLDWEREDQWDLVMEWADRVSGYVESVMFIPKIVGSISRIPLRVNNADVILGYSMPTKFGATQVMPWEFEGRKVHLLGGSPHSQMREWMYMSSYCDIVSVDGNMSLKMATKYRKYWERGRWVAMTSRTHELVDVWMKSCVNIITAWSDLLGSRMETSGR